MSAREELIEGACPLCSFLRSEHRELFEDVLVFPRIAQSVPAEGVRMRDGWLRITGCPHIKPVFGPHATLPEAREALKGHLARLREEKQRRREEIERVMAKGKAPMAEEAR